MPFKISEKEKKYFVYGVAVIFAWFALIKDALAPYLANTYIPLAAIVFDAGIIFGLYLITKPLNGHNALKFSIAGYSIYSGIDVISAPYLVTKDGLYNQISEYWFASKDVAVAEVFKSLGVTSSELYFATYVIGSVVLLLAIPALAANEKRILGYLK